MSSGEDRGWRRGRPLRDVALAAAIHEVWSGALRVAGFEGEGAPPTDVATARAMLMEAADAAVTALESGGGEQARQLVPDLRMCTELLAAAAQEDRAGATGSVQAALARLRAVESEPELLERAAHELCRCGFDRVMITRVADGVGRIEVAYDSGDPVNSRRVLAQARKLTMRLDSMKLEAEMIRRRRPTLVQEIDVDSAELHPLLQMTECRSYVAAPIIPEGRVIGLLHADCFHERRTVDEHDRDRLMLFADGLGYIVERLRLLERLQALRQEVRRANASVVAVMSEYAEAPVELSAGGERESLRDDMAMLLGRDQRPDSGLTRREREVMELIASGHTNARIASELVLSEQTVRTHVKRILRKLRAANRAEAVARWRSPVS